MYEIVEHSVYDTGCRHCDDDYSIFSDEVECEKIVAHVATEALAKAYVKHLTETNRNYTHLPYTVYYDYQEGYPPDVIEEFYLIYIGDSDKPYKMFFNKESLERWLKGKKRTYRVEKFR